MGPRSDRGRARFGGGALLVVLAALAAYFWLFEIDAIVGPPFESMSVGTSHLELLPRRTSRWLPWLRPTQLRATDARGNVVWTARVGVVRDYLATWPLVADGRTALVAEAAQLTAFDVETGRLLFVRAETPALDGPDALYDLGEVLLVRERERVRVIDRETGATRWARQRAPEPRAVRYTGPVGADAIAIDGALFERTTGAARGPAPDDAPP